MFVVIAGGGRTGATLAGTLISQGHEICVVESRPDVLAHVHHLTGLQGKCHDFAGGVLGEGDVPRAMSLRHDERQSGQQAPCR